MSTIRDLTLPEERAERLALAAVVWSVIVGIALALMPFGESTSVTTSSSGAMVETTTRDSLLQTEGTGVLVILAVPALLALASLLVRQRPIRLALGGMLCFACVLGALSVGVFFLPAAVMLVAAAVATPAEPAARDR